MKSDRKWLIIQLFFAVTFLTMPSRSEEYGFTGQRVDRETGLVHLRARYYESDSGRFITKDPIGISAGLNGYVYCGNNPINSTDPLGLWTADIHYGSADYGGTLQWAQDTGFTENQAEMIAQANRAVDSGITAPWPIIGDPSRHFNTGNGLSGSATDTRMIHATESFHQAVDYQLKANDLRENAWFFPETRAGWAEQNALKALGTGLHSLQDIDAHADQFVNQTLGIYHHLGPNGENADNPGDPQSPNSRLLNTQSATMGYLDSFLQATDVGGVLINKAAQLVGSNLSDLRGAMYDPKSGQFVFLGTAGSAAVKDIDLDYLYTALEAVYGSAVPPSVTLDPPASAYTEWVDLGDGDGLFEPEEMGGFLVRYNPIWSEEDTTVDVLIDVEWSGTDYEWIARFNCVALDGPISIRAGDRYAMVMVFDQWGCASYRCIAS